MFIRKQTLQILQAQLDRQQTQRHGFNLVFFRRFWNLHKVIFPNWRCVNVLLFVSLLFLQILEQVLIYNVGLISSVYMKVLLEKDLAGFLRHTVFSLGLIIAIALVKSSGKYTSSVFYVCSREKITQRVHSLYFRDVLYYHVNVTDTFVDNPDQRITQDVEKLCNSYSQIVAVLLLSPFTIAYYTYKTWLNTGYIGPVCVVLFFLVSSVINKFIMSPVVALVHEQQKLEGDFRYKHMQIRSNSESAAFFRAGRVEHNKTDTILRRLLNTQQKLVFKEYFLNMSINFADYLGSILSYIILAIAIFGGDYNDKSEAELAQLIIANSFITMYLIHCFTSLIDMAVTISDIAGTTHRISILMERLDDLGSNLLLDTSSYSQHDNTDGDTLTLDIPPSTTHMEPINAAYRLEGVSYGPPNSDTILVKELNLQIVAGVNLLITGDSGCGKSSLLRVLDGLWSIHTGNIDRQVNHGRHGVIFLPQKPFLTNGSLRDQIIYPCEETPVHAIPDSELIQLLKDLDLYHLVRRLGSLDIPAEWNWYDILSPGEMQRLSFVRLFFHRPPLAVLDEATSQMTIQMEKYMYETCQKLKITVISIGHRESLRQFHDVELHINSADGSWTLNRLDSSA